MATSREPIRWEPHDGVPRARCSMAKSISEETIRAIKASDRANYQRRRRTRRIILLLVLVCASVGCWIWAYRQILSFRNSFRELGPMRVLICKSCGVKATVYCMDISSVRCQKCGGEMANVLKCRKCKNEFAWKESPLPEIKDKTEFLKVLDDQRACPKCKSLRTVQILPSDDEAPPPPGAKKELKTATAEPSPKKE